MDLDSDLASYPARVERRSISPRRYILVMAPATAIFQGLVQVLKSRFPNYEVHLADDIAAVGSIAARASAILAYAEPDEEAECALRCRKHFPGATIALILDASRRSYGDIYGSDMAEGYLPLSMELEVWLSAVTLLLSGGLFYRPSQKNYAVVPDEPKPETRHQLGPAGQALTRREQQVLALLSEGLQNKLIADRMTLSEHTVKVHVHNLIVKLHVSNRTQAAAFFRSTGANRTSVHSFEHDRK